MKISGEIHYPRVPRALWKDRLLKLKRAGFNTVTSYFFWNYHELQPGQFDFSGERDVDAFLELVKELELDLIARVGPYVCAEWDNGGHPDWLLKPELVPRSLDPSYLPYAERWLTAILGKLKNYDPTAGGNMVALQLENEYFWGDMPYHQELANLARRMGISAELYTNANRYARNSGFIDSLDLYPDPWNIEFVISSIKDMAITQPATPPKIMEYEGGWFSTIYRPLPTERGPIPATWTRMLLGLALAYGVDVISFYMFHGGTNFGPWAGRWITTTYDYDAAVSEWGELRDRYYKLKTMTELARLLDGSQMKLEEKYGDKLKVVRSNRDAEFTFYFNNSDEPWQADGAAVRVAPRDLRVTVSGLKAGSIRVSSNIDLLAASDDWVIFFGDPGEHFTVTIDGGEVTSSYACSLGSKEIDGEVKEISGCLVKAREGLKRVLVLSRKLAERTWFLEYPVISDCYFVEEGDLSGLTLQSTGGKTTLYLPMEVGESIREIAMGKLTVDTKAFPASVVVRKVTMAPLLEQPLCETDEPPSIEDLQLPASPWGQHDVYVYETQLPASAYVGLAVNDFASVRSESGSCSGYTWLEGQLGGHVKAYVQSTGHPNTPAFSFIRFKTGLVSPVLLEPLQRGAIDSWEYGLVDLGFRYQPGVAAFNSASGVINAELGKVMPPSWSHEPLAVNPCSPLVILYMRTKLLAKKGPASFWLRGLGHEAGAFFVNGSLCWKGEGGGPQDPAVFTELQDGENELIFAMPIYNACGKLSPSVKVEWETWTGKAKGYRLSALKEEGGGVVKPGFPLAISDPSVVKLTFEVEPGSGINPIYVQLSGNLFCAISLNDRPLGRYYPGSSQNKFYLPEPYLSKGENLLSLKVVPVGTAAELDVQFGNYYSAARSRINFSR
ncbi:MAG: beta-galactosidase [Thermoprotei archaeon]